ncbi:adenylate cyclase [Bdellovibrio svalbardensis]|uniref:Adenylate cyclase n=1 Tax=Bdellovibrio svalbardensis TaxID=2972972 RepID=A0ABT6DKB2_9BACT|nr:adenylate cyclase [Bdellovibrio svalbardensis]MDG0817300.1 adenylate cyclase [Bdellovibrio svalbardensis]
MFAKSKWNKSIVLLIVAVFWIGYIAVSIVQFYLNAKNLTETEIRERQRSMQYVQESVIPFLVTENISLLKDRLEKSRELFLVDFYIVQRNGQVVAWYNNKDNLKGIDYDYQVFNQILTTDNVAFRTVKLMDYKFTVGVFQNKNKIIWNTALGMKSLIIRDILVVTLFVALIVYLFLKDILDLSRILASRDRSALSKVKSISREGQTLINATRSFDDTKRYLEHENRSYSESLTPAILHEMKSGRPSPYSFQSTMIRVDLNGYTQIFLDKKDEYVTEIMNIYFVRSREIIERYQGLIYQYVGDEIVFHIKENAVDSQALALAVLRSIFEVADEIEQSLAANADHHFKVKGSFVLGKIRFVNQDTGFSLSGLPLIESARLLSQVDDKSASSVTFYAEASSSVEKLCTIDQTKETLLKGFAKPSVLCRAKTFTSIEEVLRKKDLHLLTYFRGDKDLISIYAFLAKELKDGKDSEFFETYKILASYKLKQTSSEQAQAYSELLIQTTELNQRGVVSDKVMASMISIASHVVPPAMVETALIESLEKCLDHKDARVNANAIIVLGDLAQDIAFLRRFMYSKNNRVSADAILVTGKRNFDSELARKLDEFLDSKNPLFKASGAWVLRQLAEHYKTTDLVFYNTNPDLKRLEQKALAAG